ncbi:hypothetical protein IQ273_18620 [Nodosilinea sp. LEGE 07298]|uniref:protein DpdH n=1 Tax=Nodosilinea sp. LEGE 07298 TaxID=2777970 RepID=UPI00187F3F68|nr:protein DpdH [Nodosilinea sp. LEGE 07298]MBE9111422.1 hypothetical protein [Nodosilinea sp. LEGE 07298]
MAIAIGPSGKHDWSSLSEEQDYLIKSLPALLYDPFFRKHWLKEAGIIHRLIVHTLGRRDSVEIIEERRQFCVEDLPLNVLEIGKSSAQAREFYSFLIGNDYIQKASVSWLNAHLDEAIAKVLNLGREDLQRLMLDVRRALARQGVELILLIEDFAKLQGIDREVLEAVLARPQQGKGEPLCAMRTALACTTGYFEGLIDTVRARTAFNVNLDVETVDEESLVTPADVEQLTARYLNAVRLDEQEIQAWLTDTDEQTGEPLDGVPSACSTCEHQVSCHKGFGAINGIGLYPFNATAIERMRLRANKGVFNPRILIKDVLRHTLEYHRSDLEQGRFPSPLLLQHFGGSNLSAMLIREIESRDTTDNARRREALLNLWTAGQELCDLPSEVHTAFELPALGKLPPPPPLPDPVLPPPDDDSLPDTLVGYISDLDQWRTGTQLPQKVANELRSKIFSAIDARIDWDAELILRGHVIDKLFKQRNINFENAATSSHVKDIELVLPLTPEDLGDTAIALQALLLYNHHQHWKFSGGATYYRILARKLDEWSQFVLQGVAKCSTKSGEPGDPVPAVLELLALAGRMAGRPTASLEDLVNVIFTDLEKVEVTNRSGSWQKLFETLKKHQPKLMEVLQSRIPCTKGGSSRLQVIDTMQLLEPLQAISSSWQPQVDVSNISSNSPFSAIVDARKAVDELLEQALQDEKNRHTVIYERVVNELGEDFSKNEVVDAFQRTVEQARVSGLAGGVNLPSLRAAIEDFQKAKLKAYLSSLKKLQENDDRQKLLPLISGLSVRYAEIITNFLDRGNQFLTKVQEETQRELENLRSTGSGELEVSCQAIEASLLDLQQLASEINGESVCS